MDTALVRDGVVASVWRNKSADLVIAKLPEGEYDLIEVAPDGGPNGGPVICGQLWDGEALSNPPPPPPPAAPAEVPMHKVEKAALLTEWPGSANLAEAIEAGIAQLPSPKDALAMIEWKRAPNLQREGVTTLAVMAIIGMTTQQRDNLLNFAASLP